MQKRICVIGSNCFTGAHIVDQLLAEGHHVWGVSRSPEYPDLFLPYTRHGRDHFSFHQIDMVTQSDQLLALLDQTKVDTVVFVAAFSEVVLSHERPLEYLRTNTEAVIKLAYALRSRDYLKQYVHVSSAEIFGSCPEPIKEDSHQFEPSTPYAVSKLAADLYLETLSKNFDFPLTIIRSTNVFGRYQQLFKIIPRTAIYLKLGKRLELHGQGTSIKSFVHVRDVVKGLAKSIETRQLGTFHFTVPSERSVASVVRTTCELMGRDFDSAVTMVGERLGQDARYWLDCERSKTLLGWQPEVSFEAGVQETIDWIESHWETIAELPLHYEHKALALK